MRDNPKLFSTFYAKLVRVGEVGGCLDVTLRSLAELMEESWRIGRLSGQINRVNWLLYPNIRLSPQDWSELNDYQRPFILMLFCRSLGEMLASGVPGRTALEEAAGLLPLPQRNAIREVAEAAAKSCAAERIATLGFMPRMVIDMMAVGEREGGFDRMMSQVAEIYEHKFFCQMVQERTGSV